MLDETLVVHGRLYKPPEGKAKAVIPGNPISKPIPIPHSPRSPPLRNRHRGARTSGPPPRSFCNFPAGQTYLPDDIMFCMEMPKKDKDKSKEKDEEDDDAEFDDDGALVLSYKRPY